MPINPAVVRIYSSLHLFWYRLTGGTIGGSFAGNPILLLTTTGRRTGRKRTTPLLYVQDGENMVVAASNAGNTRHPAWWLNLERNPEAEVQVRRKAKRVRAEAATGDEQKRLWRRFLESYSGYKDYEQTAGREIPVVILRPVD